jgi:hypothetical protein
MGCFAAEDDVGLLEGETQDGHEVIVAVVDELYLYGLQHDLTLQFGYDGWGC